MLPYQNTLTSEHMWPSKIHVAILNKLLFGSLSLRLRKEATPLPHDRREGVSRLPKASHSGIRLPDQGASKNHYSGTANNSLHSIQLCVCFLYANNNFLPSSLNFPRYSGASSHQEAALIHPVFHVSQLKQFNPDFTPVFSELPKVAELGWFPPLPESILEHRLVKMRCGVMNDQKPEQFISLSLVAPFFLPKVSNSPNKARLDLDITIGNHTVARGYYTTLCA